MRLKSWKVLPLVLVILLVLCVVTPAQGALYYKGDWCSFEVPDGFTVAIADDNSVILQKVVSSDPLVLIQLAFDRFEDEDMSSSDYALKHLLEIYIDGFAEGLQDDGYIGDCTDAATDVFDGLHGRTAVDVRTYDYPYAEIIGQAWGENNDVVVLMSHYWAGPQVPYEYEFPYEFKDVDYLLEPLNDVYRTFEYYG